MSGLTIIKMKGNNMMWSKIKKIYIAKHFEIAAIIIFMIGVVVASASAYNDPIAQINGQISIMSDGGAYSQ